MPALQGRSNDFPMDEAGHDIAVRRLAYSRWQRAAHPHVLASAIRLRNAA